MSDDYLWDGSGKPDPEVQRLESVLGRFRHNRPVPQFLERPGFFERLRLWVSFPRFAAATAIVVVLIGAWLAAHRSRSREFARNSTARHAAAPGASGPAWDVARLEGAVKVGSSTLRDNGRLPLGEWLETGTASRVRIDVATIGQVEVEPNTRLRLVETGSNRHRLALARGTIHARIWAPPGQFFVETPSAVAVDLGCAYTLQVDDEGAGLVQVTFGWVGFEFDGRESFIPAGALCATRPGLGPGTPYFKDTSPKFRAALGRLDFEKNTSEARAADLQAVFAEARKRDAVTLWHLLSRVDESERGRVYARLAALVPPPAGVTPAGVVRLDKRMLDLWWNKLGLGDTSWWRMWKRQWPAQIRD